jgi:hypothetical protein
MIGQAFLETKAVDFNGLAAIILSNIWRAYGNGKNIAIRIVLGHSSTL